MNLDITEDTKSKIRNLTLHRFRLLPKSQNFKSLIHIADNKKPIDSKSLLFLQNKNLINPDYTLTVSGKIVIISNRFKIGTLSILILSKIYRFHKVTNYKIILPHATLMESFELFSTKKTVQSTLEQMKQKGIVDRLENSQIRINSDFFKELGISDLWILEINDYLDKINEKIESLIFSDIKVVENREKMLGYIHNA